MTHAPLPWHISSFGSAIRSKDGFRVVETHISEVRGDDGGEADAKFIVTACNSYYLHLQLLARAQHLGPQDAQLQVDIGKALSAASHPPWEERSVSEAPDGDPGGKGRLAAKEDPDVGRLQVAVRSLLALRRERPARPHFPYG